MAKRVWAWLLCMAMLLSFSPVVSMKANAVSSAMPDASAYCDHTSHNSAVWQAWAETNALPSEAGNYYLEKDVEVSVAWEVTADIHLCLNGHSITQTGSGQRVGNVRGGAELSIYDCTGKANAKITGGSGTSGAAFNVNRLGKLNLYGGTITGNGNSASGGAIYLSAAKAEATTGGMFNMYGGTITDNTAKNGIVYVAGGASGYTNTVFNMYGGTITGNSVTGNGGAILAKAYGIVNIVGGIITGNTTAAGAAVSVTDNAKLTVSGDTVIVGNTNAAKTADVVLADKLYVNELTGGSNITIQTTADQTDAANVIAVSGKQTAAWQAGWVTYMKLDGSETDIGYITSGDGKAFAFGHYHGNQKYEAYAGGNNHNLMKTTAGYYYLTADILRSTTSSGHLSLNAGGTEQHLCLNGHSFTHRNPAIRLYLVDSGDKLYIEDCTSYYNEKGQFVAGGICYGGTSDSTVADGSFAQVAAGGQLTLENIKITGFHSTKSPAIRVMGTTASRGVLNMTGVELTDNTNAGTAGVIYANTGATVNMTDCVFKNNEAKTVSVLNTGGDAQVTITDSIITGNTAASFGTINVSNPNTVIKLIGATWVTGNTGGNLHLQKGEGYVYNLDGLTAGAKVGITLIKDRITAEQMYFTTVVAEGKNPMPYCFSDDDTYKVVLDAEGRLALVLKNAEPEPEPESKHEHCLEGNATCTDHDLIGFTAWDDATKLPEASGNYYLTTDVTVTNRAGLRGANVNLCLNGYTIKAADTYAKSRAFYLYDTSKLTITDCAATPGTITGFKASAIMCDSTCTDAAVNIYNITLSGNSNTAAGGAIAMQGTGVLNLLGAKVCDNTSDSHAGGVYISGKTTATITDSVFTGNVSKGNGGAINLQPNSSLILAGTTKITGNSGATYGGAIYRHANATQLKLSGNVQITGNTVAGIESNLHLAGSSKFTVENLGKSAKVGVSTAAYNRAVSTTLTTDCSDRITSDNAEYYIAYKDSTLFLEAVFSHKHCLEGHENCTEHASVEFKPWTDPTKLPETSGNYCLMADVTVSNRAGLRGANVTLCLNGYTIKAADTYAKSRAFYLYDTSKLTITDCAATPGTITGFKVSAIMCDATCTDAQIDLYNIEVSGNSNTGSGGAIVLQGISEFNLYSGKITNNTATSHGGAIYAAGTTIVNLLGGEITGNTAKSGGGAIIGDSAKTVISLNGTKISGNTAVNGGGVLVQNRAHMEMTGGEISGNTATENGAGVYISNNSSMTMSGGKITANIAKKYTAAISVQTGAKLALSGDAQITGNTSEGTYGGIYVHNLNGGVSVSGNVQISGNTAKDQPSNLYLAGTSTFEAGKLGEKGNVGIGTGKTFRAVSKETAEDVSAGYYSDIKNLAISYQDNALFLGAPDGHSHCFCAGENNHCNHAQVKFAPWESATSLPESGNWYLTGDVVLTNRAGLTEVTLNLCLNGHTIRVDENYVKGRAFYIYGNTKLTITDCNEKPGIITGAKETAIMFDGTCDGAQYNMYNITMTGNRTTAAGGAVCIQGNAVFNMYSGTITGNSATTIVLVDENGQPKLDANGNQQLKNKLGGGGVGVIGSKAVFHLYGGEISNNKAFKGTCQLAGGKSSTGGGQGGGIYTTGQVYIHDGLVKNNTAEANGGGVMGSNATIIMTGGTISGNQATNAGGLLNQNSRGYTELAGGRITGNKATDAGGGMYISTKSKFKMTGGTISYNTAKTSGAIRFFRSEGTLAGGTITGNKAKYQYTYKDGKETKSGGTGGGVYLSGAKLYLTGTSITGNTADSNGGGIITGQATAMVNGVSTKYQCAVTMSGGTVSNNKAVNGAGILLQSATVCHIYGGTVRNNLSTTNGAGIYVSGPAELNVHGGTISDNTANQYGGGVYTGANGVTNMDGGKVTGNHAVKNGGGLYHMNSTGTYTGGIIDGNTCDGNGAAFLCSGAKTVVTAKGYDFTGCNGNNGSVATVQSKATINMEDCKFYDNQTGKGSGAVYVGTHSFGNFTNCKFYNNKSTKQGGAFYGAQNCKVTMTDCMFTENTAGTDGGAIYCRGSVLMTNCLVSDNTAAGNGGGIATGKCGIRGSKLQDGLVLVNTPVTDNTAGSQGGGLYLSTGCKTSMTDVQITGNKAAAEGGAYWAVDDTTFHNITVTGNTSGGEGFAAWYDYSVFDGHSYFVGVHKISGDIIFKDNEGGDMFFGQEVAMSVGYEGLGEQTSFGVTLDAGVLTNRLYGEYDYEGGNQVYTVSYGSRSFTEPEVDEAMAPTEDTSAQQDKGASNVLLYALIGVIGLAAIAAIVLVTMKKKKADKSAEEASKN